jgi:hypothetical protein
LNGYKVRFLRNLTLNLACMACLFNFMQAAHAEQLRLLVQSSPLAGYQYHAGNEVWGTLRVGDALTLTREPDNRHDRNAVRIDWHGHQLGYLPRAENRDIAAELDRGTKIEARIARLHEASNPWQRVLIDVFVAP